MGFFDSIAKKAINKAVGNVVDHALDSVLGNNSSQPQQTQQPTASQIIKPDLNGTVVEQTILSAGEFEEHSFKFEKTEKMYEKSSGAVEIPIYYVIADSEDEAYEDDFNTNLPEIYIGVDELAEANKGMLKGATNVAVSDVVNHSLIKKKYEFNRKSQLDGTPHHYISYKFFVDSKDEASGAYTVITLSLPDACSQEMKMYAIKSLDLLASTMNIG